MGNNMRAFTFFFGILTSLFGIACVVFKLQLFFRVMVAVFVFISVYLVLKYSKCSNCNQYSVRINPFFKMFGTCKRCGHKEQ